MFNLNGLKRKAAYWVSRALPGFLPREDVVINPWEVMRSPRSVLICAPFTYEDFQRTIPFLNKLLDRFSKSSITVAVVKEHRWMLDVSLANRLIMLTEEEHANFLKLPKKEFRDFLRRRRFDVAIDLNPSGTLFSSILCAVSGAAVRVGFTGEDSDRFFNFQIQPLPENDEAGRYRVLLNYIG